MVGQSYKVVETGAIHHVALARSTKNGKGTMRRRETEPGRRESLPKRTGKNTGSWGMNEGRGRDERGRDEMKREVEIGKREEWVYTLARTRRINLLCQQCSRKLPSSISK